MALTRLDAGLIGAFLTQIFFAERVAMSGVYVAVFALYIKVFRSKKTPVNIVNCGIFTLFILCLVAVALRDVLDFHLLRRDPQAPWLSKAHAICTTLTVLVDFLAQCILIYRCWHVYRRSTATGLLPGLLALCSCVAGLCVTISQGLMKDQFNDYSAKSWWIPLGLTWMSISLTVNVIVSGFLIIRIYQVHKETRPYRVDWSSHPANGNGDTLSWIASILLESAVFILVSQLIYLVLFTLDYAPFSIIAGPVTIIYVRDMAA
ncbi:hypothetical protein H1R20_g8912, partial [Candolleomyces eurysporus]